jgi:hypothetical protein
MKKKLYIIEKVLWATSIIDALKRERDTAPNNIYVDNEWRKNNMESA